MKAFDFIGLGLYLGNKWLAMKFSVNQELEQLTEMLVSEQRKMILKVSKNPDDGVNFITGIIWCESIEEADECLADFVTKIENGEITDFNHEVVSNESVNKN